MSGHVEHVGHMTTLERLCSHILCLLRSACKNGLPGRRIFQTASRVGIFSTQIRPEVVERSDMSATGDGAVTAPQSAQAGGAEGENPPKKMVAFKKKVRKKRRGMKRVVKRKTDGSSSEDESTIVTVSTKRKKTVNTFGTASRKKNSNAVSSLTEVSDRSTTAVENSGGATAIAEFDTAVDNDARAIRERNIELNESGVVDDTKVYRGEAGYKNYIKKTKEQLAANKFTGTQGPIRPSVFFRPSFRMDYQPDVCKDYKETGYCGFGSFFVGPQMLLNGRMNITFDQHRYFVAQVTHVNFFTTAEITNKGGR